MCTPGRVCARLRYARGYTDLVAAESSLYWSLRGEVACAAHAPVPDSPRWVEERWQLVPPFVISDLRKRLQCQYCEEGSGRPYRHERREASPGTETRAAVAHDQAAVRELALLTAQIDNLRGDYDALVRRFAGDADLSALLRRVRDHLDALTSLMHHVRKQSGGEDEGR